jgi:FkbM family methyltransferase
MVEKPTASASGVRESRPLPRAGRSARNALLDALPPAARTRLRLLRKALVGPLPAAKSPGPGRAAPPPSPPRPRQVTLRVPPNPGSAPRAALREVCMTAPLAMYVPKVLQRNGFAGYEPSSLPHFLAALQAARPGVVLDVGANVGPYSLLARACSDRAVVAFEPTPDLAQVARVTGERNGLDFLVEERALGDTDGTATLYLSSRTDSSNSLNPGFRPSSESIDVPLETLDSWVARTGQVPGIIKVDTETTEPAVLRGADRTVSEHRPWVFCEVLYGYVEEELTAAVAEWGYTWYHLTGPGPLEPAAQIVGDPRHEHFMWLFVPEPLEEEHWRSAEAWQQALELTR